MDHSHMAGGHHMDQQYHCDGNKIGPAGAYQGHMLPGVLFVIWSLHMVQGSMRQWFTCQKAGAEYKSLAYYSLPGLPDFPWESLVKILMSAMGGILELTWHDSGFQTLMCAPDTKRAGHFDGDHINNWQHMYMYLCFAVSGLIDLIGWWGVLPTGTEKAFLALAFAGETVLMGLHEKDEVLDKYLHQALAIFMLASALAAALEAAWPSSYLVSCGRASSVMLQGVMFIVIAHIRYRGYKPAWDGAQDDRAPLFYSKVMVSQALATTVCCYVGLHILMEAVVQARCSLPRGKHDKTGYNGVSGTEQL